MPILSLKFVTPNSIKPNKMIWNPTFECMTREDMHRCQSRRLSDMVERVYHNVPFYRSKMQEAGVHPEDIQSVDDLSKLPLQPSRTFATIIPMACLQFP